MTVFGSCISRIALLDGNRTGHGVAADGIEIHYHVPCHNMICAVMPPPFSKSEVDSIRAEELCDRNQLRNVQQMLDKETLRLLLDPGAEWLLMDLYDMQLHVVATEITTFSVVTGIPEFFRTALYDRYKDKIKMLNFLELPKWIVYPYVDLFFEKLLSRYDSDHIILNRFRSGTWYLDQDGVIRRIPDNLKDPWHSNDKYNAALAELEQYIIDKYRPYVIDMTKYYMGDANIWGHEVSGGHFETAFYHETLRQIVRIVRGEADERYFSSPDFFSDDRPWIDELKKERFDIKSGLKLLETLIDQGDILWLNVLDRLHIHAPHNLDVEKYVQYAISAFGAE